MFPGETLRTGASPICRDCKIKVVPQVCMSSDGYYVGTMCNCGPYSRESHYYSTHQDAKTALKSGNYHR